MTEAGDRVRPRILVVDANTESVGWLREAIGDRFEIVAHTSGAAAMDALAADDTQLLIVGAELEDMSGAELLGKLGGDPAVTSLLVLDGDAERPDAAVEDAVFYVLNRRVAAEDVRAIVDRAVADGAATSKDEPTGRAEAERMTRLLTAAHNLAMRA